MNNGNITQRKAPAATKPNRSSYKNTHKDINSLIAKDQQQCAAQSSLQVAGTALSAKRISIPPRAKVWVQLRQQVIDRMKPHVAELNLESVNA